MLINSFGFKRISAYFIDFIIVAFIAAIFSDFAIINPYYDEYYETYEEYSEFIDSSENVDNGDFLITLENYTYEISKYGVYFTIITCVVSILYYTICQYFSGGRTIGKAMFKLRIVGKKNKKVSLFQIFVRSFLVNSIMVCILKVLFIFVLDKSSCLIALSFVEMFDYLFMIICVLMILFRKDHRGLHDIISGSVVIEEKCKHVEL